jgi:hypothetical protein
VPPRGAALRGGRRRRLPRRRGASSHRPVQRRARGDRLAGGPRRAAWKRTHASPTTATWAGSSTRPPGAPPGSPARCGSGPWSATTAAA